MRSLFVLALALFATDLKAQSIGTRKAGAPPPSAEASAPRPAANTVAIVPFASPTEGPVVKRVLLLLVSGTNAAFTSEPKWAVIDRSADALLQKEMDKIVSAENFNSSVLVKSDARLNAQYVVYGFLDDAQAPASYAGGQTSYDATIKFSLRLVNVETGQVEVVGSFTARSLDLDVGKLKDRATEQALKQGMDGLKQSLTDRLKGKKTSSQSKGDRASSAVVGTVSAKSPDEALLWASERAQTLMKDWAAEQAMKFVRTSKP